MSVESSEFAIDGCGEGEIDEEVTKVDDNEALGPDTIVTRSVVAAAPLERVVGGDKSPASCEEIEDETDIGSVEDFDRALESHVTLMLLNLSACAGCQQFATTPGRIEAEASPLIEMFIG